MNVLIGCEYSGVVGRAFAEQGHDVMTCDLLPTECDSVPHYQGDVFDAIKLKDHWDLIILHPPCTALCVAGNRHYAGTQDRKDAIKWTQKLFETAKKHSARVALENPVGVLGNAIGKPTQYVQPWQFGHPETKKTGLWLHNLFPLVETNNVHEHMMTLPMKERHRIWYASPSKTRSHERSRFYTGIAAAMVKAWGK